MYENKRKEEERKVNILENKLKKRWVAWLVAQHEMNKFVHEVSKYQGKALNVDKELQNVSGHLYDLKKRLMRGQLIHLETILGMKKDNLNGS